MDDVFGITEEDINSPVVSQIDSDYVTAEGIVIPKEIADTVDRLLEMDTEDLRSLLLAGSEEDVHLTASLPLFPPIVKATAIFMGPYEFLISYCMDQLATGSDDDSGTTLADAVAIALLLSKLYNKDMRAINTRMLIKLFTGFYSYDGDTEVLGDVDPEGLQVTERYTFLKALQATGTERLFEIGAAMIDKGLFDKLGIEFTEDTTLLAM